MAVQKQIFRRISRVELCCLQHPAVGGAGQNVYRTFFSITVTRVTLYGSLHCMILRGCGSHFLAFWNCNGGRRLYNAT
jgi:hypothetical protein